MKFVFVLLSVIVLVGKLAPGALAQVATQDVVYLKNGSVLRGKLLSSPTDSTVRVQTTDLSVWAFARQAVDRIQLEPTPGHSIGSNGYRRRGFGNYTEMGPLIGRNTAGQPSAAAFSFQTVNGYKWGQAFFTGVGLGTDLYVDRTLFALTASVRGDFTSRGNVIPYYFVDAGNGFNLTSEGEINGTPTRFYGGGIFAAGLGVKIIFQNNVGFTFSVGYRGQTVGNETNFQVGGSTRTDIEFQRLAVRAGFAF